MNDFYADYDFDQSLIAHALRLLIDEWKLMKNELVQSIREGDQERYDQVFHKIITTLRRFHLFQLLQTLEEIQQQLTRARAIHPTELVQLKSEMDEIERYFETQLNVSSSALTKY